jgi:hypothetical protein
MDSRRVSVSGAVVRVDRGDVLHDALLEALDLRNDAMGLIETEHGVEEREQDVLAWLGAEDPTEHEAVPGIRKRWAMHGSSVTGQHGAPPGYRRRPRAPACMVRIHQENP